MIGSHKEDSHDDLILVVLYKCLRWVFGETNDYTVNPSSFWRPATRAFPRFEFIEQMIGYKRRKGHTDVGPVLFGIGKPG